MVDPSTQLAYANIVSKDGALWPTSACGRGWRCASISNAVKELVYAGTGTPTNNFMAPLTWAYVDIPPLRVRPGEGQGAVRRRRDPNGFKTTIEPSKGIPI